MMRHSVVIPKPVWMSALACVLAGISVLWMAGAFGCGWHPFSGIGGGNGEMARPPVPDATTTTGFGRDLRSLLIPFVWGCELVGVGTLVASLWIPLVSPRVSVAMILLGFGLLYTIHLLADHSWVVGIGVGGGLLILFGPYLHALYLKFQHVPDPLANAGPLQSLASVLPKALIPLSLKPTA